MSENKNPLGALEGVTVEKFTIKLESRSVINSVNECETRYRWKRNDGKIVSPEFSTAQCAKEYSERMLMITEKEWIERDPQLKVPKHA